MPRTVSGYPKPSGRKWQEVRMAVFRAHGRICVLCGHDGANQVDHVIPVAVAPQLAWTMSNLRPCHGVPRNRCQTCGQACNQAKQANQLVDPSQVKQLRPKLSSSSKPSPALDRVPGPLDGRVCGPDCRGGHRAGNPARCW
jgi:5-methylcytosine-specific restriction endonuclease McrA